MLAKWDRQSTRCPSLHLLLLIGENQFHRRNHEVLRIGCSRRLSPSAIRSILCRLSFSVGLPGPASNCSICTSNLYRLSSALYLHQLPLILFPFSFCSSVNICSLQKNHLTASHYQHGPGCEHGSLESGLLISLDCLPFRLGCWYSLIRLHCLLFQYFPRRSPPHFICPYIYTTAEEHNLQYRLSSLLLDCLYYLYFQLNSTNSSTFHYSCFCFLYIHSLFLLLHRFHTLLALF